MDDVLRQMIPELDEKLILRVDFLTPLGSIDFLQRVEGLARETLEFVRVEILELRHPADGGFFRTDSTVATIDHPLQHAHVVAESGPEEFAVLVFAEPVDVENLRAVLDLPAHAQPLA